MSQENVYCVKYTLKDSITNNATFREDKIDVKNSMAVIRIEDEKI